MTQWMELDWEPTLIDGSGESLIDDAIEVHSKASQAAYEHDPHRFRRLDSPTQELGANFLDCFVYLQPIADKILKIL